MQEKPKEKATEQSTQPSSNSRRKTSAARLSVGCNALLVLLKLAVGIASGSVGVLSEALHSATDLLAASIAYLSVRASDTPPDEDHPYGHGKIESVSGLAEALLIIAAGFLIIYEALNKLRAPVQEPPAVGAGLAVMAFAAVVTGFLSQYLRRVAQETDSLALEADARHLRTDVVTSVGVAVGLALVRLTGRAWFDPALALCVSLLILHTGYKLGHDALHPLLDARLPVEEEAAIQEVLETHPGVLSYHKLRTRKAGSQRHADVHVQIDDNCSLVEAHALTEQLEDGIRAALSGININIHIEPYLAELRHQQEVHGVSAPTSDQLAEQISEPVASKAKAAEIKTENGEEKSLSQ